MLLKCCPDPNSVAATYCVPFDPADPLINLYNQAATQFDSDNDASLNALIVVSLQNRMLLYRKTTCTDCAGPTNLAGAENTEYDINGGLSALNQGLQTGESLAQSGSAIATNLSSAIPVVGAITGIISSIVGVFGAAHAKAVAREQATNCAAAQQFNTYIPRLDAAVASGQVDAQAGIQTAQQIIETIKTNLQPVVSAHNWGWGAQQVLDAQLWFRQQWYPTLEGSAGGLGGILGGGITSSPVLLLALVFGAVLLFGRSKAA